MCKKALGFYLVSIFNLKCFKVYYILDVFKKQRQIINTSALN